MPLPLPPVTSENLQFIVDTLAAAFPTPGDIVKLDSTLTGLRLSPVFLVTTQTQTGPVGGSVTHTHNLNAATIIPIAWWLRATGGATATFSWTANGYPTDANNFVWDYYVVRAVAQTARLFATYLYK